MLWMLQQHTDPRPEGKGKRLFFLTFKKQASTSSPEHSNVFQRVKPPEKQKQTVQITVERIIRSCLRSKHKREKKKFNRIGSFYDHKEAFEAEGSKEKARKRRGVCVRVNVYVLHGVRC